MARMKVPPAILKSVAAKLGKVVATWLQVPLPRVKVAALTEVVAPKAPLPFNVRLPVVVNPAVLTVPMDQLAALLVRLTEPVLPATVVTVL